MDSQDLLKLPFDIQLTLAMGYVGYRVFSSGLDKKHKSHDSVFQILLFGLPAYASIYFVPDHLGMWRETAQILLALFITLLLSLVVRRTLPSARKIFQTMKITSENYYPSTWTSLIYNEGYEYNLIAILLQDGTWLESDLREIPKDVPHYPCDFDAEGNIAIYVTEKTDPGGNVKISDVRNICSSDAGAGITYIPASEIRRVLLTKKTKKKKKA